MGTDKEGVAFDPSLHFADKEGKGVLTKAGVWRKRPGTKASPVSDTSELLKRIADLEARLAAPKAVDPRLAAAEEELARLKAPVRSMDPPGTAPGLVPYKGMVRSLCECFVGQHHKAGETFQIDVPALWTDDPFEAVKVVAADPATGLPIFGKDTSAVQIDFRFRPRSHEAVALSDGPRRAAEY